MAVLVIRRFLLGIVLLPVLALALPLLVVLYLEFLARRSLAPDAESLFYSMTCRYPVFHDLFMVIGNYPQFEDIYRCLPPMEGRVLHLACGTGFGTRVMERPGGNQVVNLDVNRTFLGYAKRMGRIGDFVCASAYELPFPDRSFDWAVLPIAFHHFRDPEGLLRECGRVLRADGIFVVLDPVSIRRRTLRLWNSFHDGAIWTFDTESLVERLRSAAAKHGMRILSVDTHRPVSPECYNLFYDQTLMIVQIAKNP